MASKKHTKGGSISHSAGAAGSIRSTPANVGSIGYRGHAGGKPSSKGSIADCTDKVGGRRKYSTGKEKY